MYPSAVGVGRIQVDQTIAHEIRERFLGGEPVTSAFVVGDYLVQIFNRVSHVV